MKMQFKINGTIIRLSSMLIATTFFFTSCSSSRAEQNMSDDDEELPTKKQTIEEALMGFAFEHYGLIDGCEICSHNLEPGIFAPSEIEYRGFIESDNRDPRDYHEEGLIGGDELSIDPDNSSEEKHRNELNSEDPTGLFFTPCFHVYHRECLNKQETSECGRCNTCKLNSEELIPLSRVFENIKTLCAALNTPKVEFLEGIPFCLWRLLICSVDSVSFESFLISKNLTYKKIAQQLMWTKPGEYTENIDNEAFVNFAIAALQGNYGFVPINGLLSLSGKSFSHILYSRFKTIGGVDGKWLVYETTRQVCNVSYRLRLIAQSTLDELLLRDSIISIANDLIKELNSFQGDPHHVVKKYFNKSVGMLTKFKNFCETTTLGFKELKNRISELNAWLGLELLDRMQFKFSKNIIEATKSRLEELKKQEKSPEKMIKHLNALNFPFKECSCDPPTQEEVKLFFKNQLDACPGPDTTMARNDALKNSIIRENLTKLAAKFNKLYEVRKELEKLNNTYRKNHPPIYPQGPKQ